MWLWYALSNGKMSIWNFVMIRWAIFELLTRVCPVCFPFTGRWQIQWSLQTELFFTGWADGRVRVLFRLSIYHGLPLADFTYQKLRPIYISYIALIFQSYWIKCRHVVLGILKWCNDYFWPLQIKALPSFTTLRTAHLYTHC